MRIRDIALSLAALAAGGCHAGLELELPPAPAVSRAAIETTGAGWIRASADELIAAGLDPDAPADSLRLSRDGRTIAFVTGGRVWLIDRDGRNLRQLLPDGYGQLRPAFSPDGTKIAMIVCNSPGIDYTGEVVVVDVASGRVTPIRTRAGDALIPDDSSRVNWVR